VKYTIVWHLKTMGDLEMRRVRSLKDNVEVVVENGFGD
jgi:hypothetical protein